MPQKYGGELRECDQVLTSSVRHRLARDQVWIGRNNV